MLMSTTDLQCEHSILELKAFETELKSCCILCYGKLCYDMMNEIWNCMLWFVIPMSLYEIPIVFLSKAIASIETVFNGRFSMVVRNPLDKN